MNKSIFYYAIVGMQQGNVCRRTNNGVKILFAIFYCHHFGLEATTQPTDSLRKESGTL
jgi:hypothetical protein